MADFIQRIRSEDKDQVKEVKRYEIKYYPADYTLQVLFDKWKKKEIRIPQFQRGYVWTTSQASKLIESFLLGLPVPGVFFYRERKTQELLVIDGQQRLKTIFSFFEGTHPNSKRKFYLTDVNSKWEGSMYADLTKADKIKLNDSILRAVIVDQVNPDDNTSIYHIFERLNTGGTILKPQEVRNCLYDGLLNEALKELNNDKYWRALLGSRIPDKRMRDIELILRFLALFSESSRYRSPMKEFLSDFMKKYRDNKSEIKAFKSIFMRTTKSIIEELGPAPFKLTAGINVAILDAVMVAFAKHLSKISPKVKQRYERLKNNQAFLDYVSDHTTDEKIVKKRIELATEILFRK